MILEIYEKAPVSSSVSDLDLMLDYIIECLEKRGVQTKRYDRLTDPEAFKKIDGYALPVIILGEEIISAGSYDFTSLDKRDLAHNNSSCYKQCSGHKCNSCPGKSHCNKINK